MIIMVFSGLLGALSFPPLPFFFLAWVMFIPWFVAIEKGKSRFRYGFVSGLVYHALTLHWIAFNSALSFWAAAATALLAVLYLSIWWGLIFQSVAYQYRHVGRPAFLQVPLMMALVEFITSFWDLGFPWVAVGATQLSTPGAVGIFSTFGVFGATLWLGGLNFILYMLFKRRWLTGAVVTGILLLLLPFTGSQLNRQLLESSGDTLRVGVIQPNLDPHVKWSAPSDSVMSLNLTLYNEAVEQGAQLIVFPETAAPLYLNRSARWRQELQQAVTDDDVTLAIGALASQFLKDQKLIFNSVFFFDAVSHNLRYDKQQLVPFGERFPFQRWLPSLGSINLGQAEFAPGKGEQVLTLIDSAVAVAPSICFESIFPHLQSSRARQGADLLINVTNDGWYLNTLEPAQHYAQSRIRVFENGVPLVRAANNGISAIVDSYGAPIAELPENQQEVLVCDLPLYTGSTFYTTWGNNILRLTLLSAALYLLMFYGSVSWRSKVSKKSRNVLP